MAVGAGCVIEIEGCKVCEITETRCCRAHKEGLPMFTAIDDAKILIGDDSEILNNMLKDLFEDDGFEVVQAFNGYECKTLFLKENPDLALVDVQMPQADGIEVLRFIKSKSKETVVVLMTGAGSEETAVRAMKLGADEYITKPFRTDHVVELARKLLRNRAAMQENIRLRKRIREGERHLAHLTKIINEGLITTDEKGRIQFANLAATKMWGYSEEELKGKDIHFLVRGEARTLLYRDLVRDTLRKGTLEGEFHFRKKDKGSFPGYLSTSVIEEKNRVRGIVVVVADLTKVYEFERRLKQSEKLASLGIVVEGVAHEVRNCLTSLGGFARRLKKTNAEDSSNSRYANIMLDDVGRLEKMVKDIEDYVHFSKFYSFKFRKVDLPSIIDEAHKRVVQGLTPQAVKAVTWRQEVEKGLPEISADPDALEEVFYNIILNAYDAMPGGGKLVVSVKQVNAAISIAFTDKGPGIRKEDITEIFNPFFTSKTTGAGMGLSKVYLLVQEHRGAVNVTSELNKGTTFEVFLPLERLLTGLFSWETEARGGSSA